MSTSCQRLDRGPVRSHFELCFLHFTYYCFITRPPCLPVRSLPCDQSGPCWTLLYICFSCPTYFLPPSAASTVASKSTPPLAICMFRIPYLTCTAHTNFCSLLVLFLFPWPTTGVRGPPGQPPNGLPRQTSSHVRLPRLSGNCSIRSRAQDRRFLECSSLVAPAIAPPLSTGGGRPCRMAQGTGRFQTRTTRLCNPSMTPLASLLPAEGESPVPSVGIQRPPETSAIPLHTSQCRRPSIPRPWD